MLLALCSSAFARLNFNLLSISLLFDSWSFGLCIINPKKDWYIFSAKTYNEVVFFFLLSVLCHPCSIDFILRIFNCWRHVSIYEKKQQKTEPLECWHIVIDSRNNCFCLYNSCFCLMFLIFIPVKFNVN